jgi:hypothetical protein
MKRLLQFAALFFLLASTAAAQGVRFSATVTQQGTVGTSTNVVVLPVSPVVKFCLHPANAVPCSNLATTYTDQTLATPCAGATQIVRDGTTTCVAFPDAQNNWGVWVAPNTLGYDYTITLPGGVNLGPFNVLSETTSPNVPWTFTGAVTATGANVFNCKTLENGECLDDSNSQSWTGTDIGGWFNSAYGNCLAGTCRLDAFSATGNRANFSTPMVASTLDKVLNWECRHPSNSNLTGGFAFNFTPTTATTMLTLDYQKTTGIMWVPSQIKGCSFSNNQNFIQGGNGSSAIGLAQGVTNGGAGWLNLMNDTINGFGTGVLMGNGLNGWGWNFNNTTIGVNTLGVSLTGSQEVTHFHESRLISNGTGFKSTSNSSVVAVQTQCDSNTVMCWDFSSATGGGLQEYGVHHENFNTSNCLYGNFGGAYSIGFGGDFLNDTATTNCTQHYIFSGATIYGLFGTVVSSAGQTATNLFTVNTPAVGHFQVMNNSPSVYTTDASLVGGNSTSYIFQPCTKINGGTPGFCHSYFFNNNTPGTAAAWSAVFGRLLTPSAGGTTSQVTVHYDAATEWGLLLDYESGGTTQRAWTMGAGVCGAGNSFTVCDYTGSNAQRFTVDTANAITTTNAYKGNTVALTADWTCGTGGTVSSCVAATIIGSGGGVPLTFTLPLVAQSWTLECDGVVGQATAATANQWNLLTATNGATNVTANYSMATAATASAYGAVTDQASTTTTFQIAPSWTLGGTATKMPFHIWAKVEGASASGTVLSLQLVAPTVGDLVTIYRGSSCRIY